MKILITGSEGQLGQEVKKLLEEKSIPFLATTKNDLDITNQHQVTEYLKKNEPNFIFHCAAYTAVDKAEDEDRELNYLVNEVGTKNIAHAAESIDATVIYISTDYVFDGRLSSREYLEDDQTAPLNEYGRAKLAGEKAISEICSKYYIVRTSWVFGQFGPNFVFTMERLAKTNKELTIVNDQFGRPTWTKTLAEFLIYLTEKKIEYGIYHLSNDNSCSWFEFAKEILVNQSVEIMPVNSSQFPQKAKRPQFSIMNLSKVKATGFIIPTWQTALMEMKAALEEE